MSTINQNHLFDLARELCIGKYDYNIEDYIWKYVFEVIIRENQSITIDKKSFHTCWTVNGGHLRRKVQNDDLVLEVLKSCLPKYNGPPLKLYRGECKFLFEENQVGFCWTPEIDVARKFASGLNSVESGGVLLEAFVPTTAILSSPNDHSRFQMEEHEYTCNPKLIMDIKVIESFEKIG